MGGDPGDAVAREADRQVDEAAAAREDQLYRFVRLSASRTDRARGFHVRVEDVLGTADRRSRPRKP